MLNEGQEKIGAVNAFYCMKQVMSIYTTISIFITTPNTNLFVVFWIEKGQEGCP